MKQRKKITALCQLSVYLMFSITVQSLHAEKEGFTEDDLTGPGNMMSRYLLDQSDAAWQQWQLNFEDVKTPEEIQAYQERMRPLFLKSLGDFPERTPLNAQVVGTLQRPGYRVEKILFESQPRFHVTGSLFIPDSDKWPAPYPGVLVPCGHTENGKAWDEYQSMGALLALNGMVALVYDPVDQGERMQIVNKDGIYPFWGTRGHTMAGIGCILLARNTATYEIWDGMRAIDYLQSRPEVDPERIGCTGNSGGGTQTSMLMALDPRIKAAAPSCWIETKARQLQGPTGDAEQNIYAGLKNGLEHADFIMMCAPSPVLVCAATKDFFDIRATWEAFRYAKRRFTTMGHAEKVDILENDAGHNYNRTQREGVARWMARWLQDRVVTITEPELDLFSEKELQCTPRGQVMLLAGERSMYDINKEMETQYAGLRAKRLKEMTLEEIQSKIRNIAVIRKLEQLPPPKVEKHQTTQSDGGSVCYYTIWPEDGIWLPAVLYCPATVEKDPILLLHENGKKAVEEESLRRMKSGQPVLAVDLRGTGETEQTAQTKFGKLIGLDWEDYYRGYVLGRSYVGMRAEDILICARWLGSQYQTDAVAVDATGHIGVPALHAAALEPHLIKTLHLDQTLASWRIVVSQRPTYNQLINTIHGALRVYDLPDLAALVPDRITIEHPVDAQRNPLQQLQQSYTVVRDSKESTFDITDYGAVAGGEQLCTAAIQKTVDACHQAGGGQVIVPKGTFLCGGLILKSNVNLYLAEGARLLGSANLEDYPIKIPEFKSRTNDLYVNRSILYAEKAKNVSVTGLGIIDGNGRDPAFSRTYPQKNRPFVARFVECENLTIRNVSMLESANWTCHLLGCDQVTVDGLKIRNSVRANRDGLDIDSSRNVSVTNCQIYSQDDAIVLKSTSYEPAKQILIENCEVSSHASGIKMGTESSRGFEDVIIRHCKIRDVPNVSGLGFMIVDGGSIRNIQVSDIVMDRVNVPIFLRLGKRSRPVAAGDPVPGVGIVEDVSFSNITAKHAGYPCNISGLHERKIDSISFKNISLQFDYQGQTDPVAYNKVPFKEQSYPYGNLYGDSIPASAFYFRNVSNLSLQDINIEITGRNERVPFVLDRIKDAKLRNCNIESSIDLESFFYIRNAANVSLQGRNRKNGLAYVIYEKDNCYDLRLKEMPGDGMLGYREVESLPDKTYEDVSAYSRVKFEGDTYRGKSCIKLDQKNTFTLDAKKGSPCQILFLAACEQDEAQRVELLINQKRCNIEVDSAEWRWSSIYILEPLETSTVTLELLGKLQSCVRIAEAALVCKAITD